MPGTCSILGKLKNAASSTYNYVGTTGTIGLIGLAYNVIQPAVCYLLEEAMGANDLSLAHEVYEHSYSLCQESRMSSLMPIAMGSLLLHGLFTSYMKNNVEITNTEKTQPSAAKKLQ
jgi:hypothetical protein